ncbi:hypothetical protein [Vibrio alginolyticus]|uniref:hypothetical protein n=1 Tax=Vibrio alginolyticus TaxID=663 RepID=UPI003D7E17BE
MKFLFELAANQRATLTMTLSASWWTLTTKDNGKSSIDAIAFSTALVGLND